MSWQRILKLGPSRIAEVLGCPKSTASSWIHRSGPPKWIRKILAAQFEENDKEMP